MGVQGHGAGIFGGPAEDEQRGGLDALRNGEGAAHGLRVKMHDPAAAHACVMGGEHHVGGHDGGVHRRGQGAVVLAHPALGGTVADQQSCGRAEVAAGTAAELLHGFIGVQHQDPLGLVVAAGGGEVSRIEDLLQDLPGQMLRSEIADGIAALDQICKFHGCFSFSLAAVPTGDYLAAPIFSPNLTTVSMPCREFSRISLSRTAVSFFSSSTTVEPPNWK